MKHLERHVWVFTSGRTSGVFTSLRRAETWIGHHQLSGTLSAYPLDEGVYDWSVRNGYFKPSKPHHGTPEQVARFDSAFLPHVHYLNGQAQAGHEEAVALARVTEEP